MEQVNRSVILVDSDLLSLIDGTDRLLMRNICACPASTGHGSDIALLVALVLSRSLEHELLPVDQSPLLQRYLDRVAVFAAICPPATTLLRGLTLLFRPVLLLLPLCPVLRGLCLCDLLPLTLLRLKFRCLHFLQVAADRQPFHILAFEAELRTLADMSSIILSLSYSLRRLALYTWNSPDPAPALEPCTFFIISRAGRIAFSFGGAGTKAGFAGSLSSRSSCERCFSTAVNACLWVDVGVGEDDEGIGELDMRSEVPVVVEEDVVDALGRGARLQPQLALVPPGRLRRYPREFEHSRYNRLHVSIPSLL